MHQDEFGIIGSCPIPPLNYQEHKQCQCINRGGLNQSRNDASEE